MNEQAITVAKLVETARARRRLPDPVERKLLRESAGVSLSELAAAIGVDPATVWRWERGTNRPRAGALVRYVAVLDELREVGW